MLAIAEVVLSNLDTLSAKLPLVREGDVDAIHDARVATRRVRAALPLLSTRQPGDASDGVDSVVKAIGRALGKVRDQDEALRLVAEVEGRAPVTAPAAAVLRARLLPEQLRQRRRLIKTLEGLDLAVLDRLREALQEGGRPGRRIWGGPASPPRLAAVVGRCAQAVEASVQHASAIYFPNRAHKARVAIKKLRYATELMDTTEAVRKPSERVLRKAQATLGNVHDREMLLRRLLSLAGDTEVPAARELAGVLEAECRSLFATYRELRPAVFTACADLTAWSRQRVPRRHPALLIVGVVALPSAAVLLVKRARRAG
jgi:CHAD domain-containing protein